MRVYLDPEALASRVCAKVGGLPFQVVVTVDGRRDLLVLVGSELAARRPGQSTGELRAWATSDFADLDPADALAKVQAKIAQIDVLVTKNGHYRVLQTFATWETFEAWLADAQEPIERFTVELPASLYLAAKKAARKRKEAGGRGTLRELVVAAVEEHLTREA